MMSKAKSDLKRHTIAPVFDDKSTVLILGSFPSVKSREENFYYAHKQNRFWKVMASVFGDEFSNTEESKKEFLHRNGIALWDVIASCEIEGSSDASIKSVTPNNLRQILDYAQIKKIILNGGKAAALFKKYQAIQICEFELLHNEPRNEIEILSLPSTSPANARYSLQNLIEAWKGIAKD